jgi:hypothetical protein
LSFVLGFIVWDLPEDLQDVLEFLTRWRNQKYSCSRAFELERAVEVHHLMLWPLGWSW